MPHHGSSSSLASSACSVQSGCTDKTVDNLSMKEGRCDSVIMDGRYVITLLVLRLLSSFIWHLWLLNYVHTCAGTGSMRALDCKNRPNPFPGCMLNGATGLDFGFMFIFCHSFWWFIDACLLFLCYIEFLQYCVWSDRLGRQFLKFHALCWVGCKTISHSLSMCTAVCLFTHSYILCRQYYHVIVMHYCRPSVLWHCWLGIRKSTRPVKIEWWGVGVVNSLEWDADCLHMVHLMPLPSPNPIISCLI